MTRYYLGRGPLIPDTWGPVDPPEIVPAACDLCGEDCDPASALCEACGDELDGLCDDDAPRFRFRCECGAKGPERGHRFQAAQDEADHREEVAS